MSLKLIEKADFYGLTCNVYQNENHDIFMTREQIGRALEYADPQKAIDKIYERNKTRLNAYSVTVNLTATDGKKYKTILYSFEGAMEICRVSKQPKANKLFDWVYRLLKALTKKQAVIMTQKDMIEWKESRNISKVKSKLLNDTAVRFADYARAQGCKKAQFYIINFNKLINKNVNVDLCNRDNADIAQLTNLVTVMTAIDKYINDCMNKNIPYYTVYEGCKSRIQTAREQGLLINN